MVKVCQVCLDYHVTTSRSAYFTLNKHSGLIDTSNNVLEVLLCWNLMLTFVNFVLHLMKKGC